MVSPGTPLVKNRESMSMTSVSQSKKKQGVRNWKYLGFYSVCNQTVNMETGAKTLYHSLVKLKYSRSIYLKHKKDLILNLHF